MMSLCILYYSGVPRYDYSGIPMYVLQWCLYYSVSLGMITVMSLCILYYSGVPRYDYSDVPMYTVLQWCP